MSEKNIKSIDQDIDEKTPKENFSHYKKMRLSLSMTETQFENGYWYAAELKAFAKEIGIPSASKLRKDELEQSIKYFFRTGKVELSTQRSLTNTAVKDVDLGLSLELPIRHYTSNKETKSFIVAEAKKQVPNLKEKSGVRYRLNRWREEQLTQGIPITYGDLVNRYIELNQTKEKFSQIPTGRYINFISDFLAQEANATRSQAIEAWEQLKELDAPKTYESWKAYKE